MSKKCRFCNLEIEDDANFCPYCGKSQQVSEINIDNENQSIFLKYSSYLDTNQLYRIALAKEKGVIRNAYDGEYVDIYKVLAFRGHLDSIYKYAMQYLDKDKGIAYKWLKIGADAGSELCKIKLNEYDWFDDEDEGDDEEIVEVIGDNEYLLSVPKDAVYLKDQIDMVLPSIVSITVVNQSDDGAEKIHSSGFVLKGGFVVTNAHILGEHQTCIEARFESSIDKKVYPLYPTFINNGYDIAILLFPDYAANALEDIPKLDLSFIDNYVGQDVFTIGNKKKNELVVSKGTIIVDYVDTKYPKYIDSMIKTDISFEKGNSGGALMDMYGKVVGITTCLPEEYGGNNGFCIPSRYIFSVIKRLVEKK